MPSQRKKDKRSISVWVNFELYAKVKKLAKSSNLKMSELVTAHLVQLTNNVILTPEEYLDIYNEQKKKNQDEKNLH